MELMVGYSEVNMTYVILIYVGAAKSMVVKEKHDSPMRSCS